jgi:hypothetical protein
MPEKDPTVSGAMPAPLTGNAVESPLESSPPAEKVEPKPILAEGVGHEVKPIAHGIVTHTDPSDPNAPSQTKRFVVLRNVGNWTPGNTFTEAEFAALYGPTTSISRLLTMNPPTIQEVK